jgi:tetratricopeptide (TPR) repeat protein
MGETLTRALDIAVTNEDRRVILFDLGELLEKQMSQVDQGMAYYKRSLEVDPLYLPALEALERLYAERNSTPELIQILTSKAKALTEPDQIVQTSLRMGDLYEKQLKDLERAGQVYREVLLIDGSNLVALRGLERVSESLQRWNDLVEVLERQLDVVGSERERVEVLLKLASIQEEQFLKADVAAQRLEQVLELDHTEKRAYAALERCYRRLKQWQDLIGAYERHISDAADQGEKPELFRNIAQVYADEIGDADQAITAYQNIVDIDDTNIEALEALAKLYEKQGDTAASIDAMIKVADLTSDGTQRVEMYYRIGRALDEKLGDRVQAQERFEMALDLNPAHLPSLGALRTIAIDEQDWVRAATHLDQEQQHTEQPRTRAKLLVELGKVRDEQLGERELAVQAYELAIQADPDCEEAALPLVEEYVATERFKEAEPLAEMLVRKSRNRERTEQHTLNRMLGKIHAALGNDEKAMKA